jgi:hypothetical protein
MIHPKRIVRGMGNRIIKDMEAYKFNSWFLWVEFAWKTPSKCTKKLLDLFTNQFPSTQQDSDENFAVCIDLLTRLTQDDRLDM